MWLNGTKTTRNALNISSRIESNIDSAQHMNGVNTMSLPFMSSGVSSKLIFILLFFFQGDQSAADPALFAALLATNMVPRGAVLDDSLL